MRRALMALSLLGLLVAGCASDPATSKEYQTLQQQQADTQQQLTDVQRQLAEAVAERDALASAAPQPNARHDKAKATQEAIQAILDDPESVGTEQEVVDALASLATPDAMMVDDVFGAVNMLSAWRQTLYGGTVDATVDTTYMWLSEDGSQGGSLWLWHGTNLAGNPFELAGIALNDYNEDGLVSNSYVVYPYPADYVTAAFEGAGT
jgi:hypothetical protein